MEIRRADGDDDLRAAIRCYNRAWRVGFRGMVPEDVIEAVLRDTDDAAVAALEEASTRPSTLLVAERDGTVVGYLQGRYAETSEFVDLPDAELAELYVDPAHWREGAGTALLWEFVEWVPGHVNGVTVKILAENDRAQAFFEASDFVFQDTDMMELAGDLHGAGLYRLELHSV